MTQDEAEKLVKEMLCLTVMTLADLGTDHSVPESVVYLGMGADRQLYQCIRTLLLNGKLVTIQHNRITPTAACVKLGLDMQQELKAVDQHAESEQAKADQAEHN